MDVRENNKVYYEKELVHSEMSRLLELERDRVHATSLSFSLYPKGEEEK